MTPQWATYFTMFNSASILVYVAVPKVMPVAMVQITMIMALAAKELIILLDV
jgi:hypothetical protein